jgi:hypothetical protein
MKRILLLVPATFLVAALNADPSHAQAPRTWVSGGGDDANPCSFTAPCKTFAGAISKTMTGGEINCIDGGGFGALTITKSLAIQCEYTEAGVLAGPGSNGITVNAPAGSIVTLRGLDIVGAGTGLSGVNFIQAGVLHVEKCIIRGFNAGTAGFGIRFAPTGAGQLFVSDTVVTNNGTGKDGAGISIQPTGTGSAEAVLNRVQAYGNTAGITADATGGTGAVKVSVRDSTTAGSGNNGIAAITAAGGGAVTVFVDRASSVNNTVGVLSTGTAQAIVFISNSTFTGNGTGLSFTADGQLLSYKNNSINGNGTDGVPSGFVTQN